MKDQLQPQEIAGYLPHELRVIHASHEIYSSSNIWILEGVVKENVYLKEITYPTDIFAIKPILRPMSDLTKEITHNGKTFTPVYWLEDFYDNLDLHEQAIQLSKDYRWVNQSDYMLIMHLIEWHFDIHNLIGRGLAISIHDIPTK